MEHTRGPMMVIAGAGTGKTSVLTNRVAHLVEDGHAQPDEIVTLTYTKNAAAEMHLRIRAMLGGKEVQAATFHDFCNAMLFRAGRGFDVLDDTDLWIYLRRRIHEFHLEHYVRAANVSQFLHDLLDFMSRCHDELITPAAYAEYVQRLEKDELPIPRVAKSKNQLGDSEVLARCREIARVFTLTEHWLNEDKLGTFSHMITRAHTLLQSDASFLAEQRKRARFILVDEFQDANFAQIKILTALAGSEKNIFVVGDPDQGIYRFRGASSAAFELFRRHFPQTRRVVLQKNRRSTTPILRCGFALIDKNPQVFANDRDGVFEYARVPLQSTREEEAAKEGKPLRTVPVEVVTFEDKQAESPDIVSVIRGIRRELRCKWSDFGILYRLHAHRDDVIRELAEGDVPFVIESMDVSDSAEVRDLFACLNAVVSMGDDVSLFRVCALPCFEVAPEQLRAAMRALARRAREGQLVPLASILHEVEGGRGVLTAVNDAREEIARRNATGRYALEIIAKQFDLDASSSILRSALNFVSDRNENPLIKTGDLGELVVYLRDFREAGGVIPMLSDGSPDAVRLMTVHMAKGLEFPHVFILRANTNSFPSSFKETLVAFPKELLDPDSVTTGDDKALHDQEERRLFYVAMTRARDSLHIYARQGRGKKNKNPDGFTRSLIEDASLGRWLRSRPVCGDQATLSISASASALHSPTSHMSEWLNLQATPGLHSKLSASAVDTYERCPLQFKLERDWQVSRELPAAMQYGAVMHRVLRTYYDSVRLGLPRSDEELIQQFRDELVAAKISEQYQHDLYEEQGVQQLRAFLTSARSLPVPDVLHTEEGFEIRVGETKVVGRIDRIDRVPGGVVIVDYKTGKARDQEDADSSLQLSLYALAAQEKWGYRVDSLVFHNLEENVPVFTSRNDLQLLEAHNRVEAAARNIFEEKFEAKVGFHCGFCPYRNLCPAKEKRIPLFGEALAKEAKLG